ncbi:MAG: rhodanese-like domain-containing protein [Phycisphaerae bacterium]|nr:rhodanese-like domain-containing protein [Phycisphaerae bacterium]
MRMIRLALPAGIVAFALLAGCDPSTDDRSVVWITPPDAINKLNTPGGVFKRETRGIWVDPRSPKAYEEGHIPGAISLPLPEMRDAAPAALAGYNLILVYDSDFSDVMAKAGAKRLIELGFTEVYALQGGLRSWKKDGYEVVTGPNPK